MSNATVTHEQLVAERDCRNLILDFALAVDTLDYAAIGRMFTPEGSFARPTDPDNHIRGQEAIVKMFEARPKGVLSQHIVTNIRVTLDGADRARARSLITLYLAQEAEAYQPGKGRPKSMGPLMGIYDDHFERTAGGWKFSARHGRVTMFAA